MNPRQTGPSRFLLGSLMILLAETPLSAQGIRRAGAQVYAKTCANHYCHGAQGVAGAAPAVAGKALTQQQVDHIVREGIPNTSMAGWKDTLSSSDLAAVIDYVYGLQKATASGRAALDPDRPWLKHPGRELFFDANRITPCGACHEFDGLGLAVATPFKAVSPANVSKLRMLKSDRVRTIRPRAGEPFVGVSAPSKAGVPRWYDLSAELPVLRTFETSAKDSGPASSWSHGDAIGTYSDTGLEMIHEFLEEALDASEKDSGARDSATVQ